MNDSYRDYEIQIRLFGSMQVETRVGVVKEPGRESEAWKILKYLLVRQGITVSEEELQEVLWKDTGKLSYNNFHLRLNRLRSALKDINLGGRKGLVLLDNGLFDLNPEYDIQTDVAHFDSLMEQIRNTPVEDAEGLSLCAQALTLYRGEYMGRTQGAWLDELRTHYRNEFQYLIRTTLERTRILRDPAAVSILSSRVAAIMPENEQLRREIICVGRETNKLPELSREKQGKNSRKAENKMRIRLFGLLELENQFGCVGETDGQPSQAWLLLKYLVVNRGREVRDKELMEQLWKDSRIDAQKNGNGTLRVYLNRLRQELKPLHLDGKVGLVSASVGYYGLNPDFEVSTDTDDFLVLMNKIRNTPVEDPQGLALCVDALELFRGKVFENTQAFPWLEQAREQFKEELCFLICSTLKRMEILCDCSAVSLVSRRALDIVPEETELHREIIHFLMEQNLREELLRHMTQWLGSGHADAGRQAESRGEDASETGLALSGKENAVAVTLFGPVILENRYGRLVEYPGRTPEIWMFLKYLLVHRDREVSQEELVRALLGDAAGQDVVNTFMLRRRRARSMLESLRLGGTTDGLILFEGGVYRINPDYVVHTDEEMFQYLMDAIREMPENDPEGLNTCEKALKLYHGKFMQHTKDAAWLAWQQKHYDEELCYLVHNTFCRMKALGDSRAVGLLGRRVASMMPQAKELHMEIISYMIEQKRQEELEEFVAALTH